MPEQHSRRESWKALLMLRKDTMCMRARAFVFGTLLVALASQRALYGQQPSPPRASGDARAQTVPQDAGVAVADIQATGSSASVVGNESTYTVRPGDTLSKIAKEKLGDPSAYTQIFNLNRDQLSDPDKIKPGQVLKIPQAARP